MGIWRVCVWPCHTQTRAASWVFSKSWVSVVLCSKLFLRTQRVGGISLTILGFQNHRALVKFDMVIILRGICLPVLPLWPVSGWSLDVVVMSHPKGGYNLRWEEPGCLNDFVEHSCQLALVSSPTFGLLGKRKISFYLVCNVLFLSLQVIAT